MPDLFVAKSTGATPSPSKVPLDSSTKKQQSLHFFSAYCENPKGVRVQNQEANEEILLFLRRHFIRNIGWVLITFFLLLVPPVIFVTLQMNSFLPTITFPQIAGFIGLYYLFVFTYAYIHFIEWFYNVGIVTNTRVIDVDFENLLYKDVGSIDLNDIVDAEYKQGGFLSSFFDYGTVILRSVAITSNFEFTDTPKPSRVVEIVASLTGRKK